MGMQYNDPAGGTPSSVGNQFNTFHYIKQALIEARKEQYFSQLADTTSMPKNMGKKIKRYHYIPLLDDANINDQGIDAAGVTIANGNLYGSSKDVGTITDKLPVLSETGGRVNRVGFKRKELEGSFEKFGFFDEYTQESLDFDTDAELLQHINREMLNGANEITEDALQIDLLNSAGVIRYAGGATQNSEIDGTDLVEFGDLMRLSIDLDNNRTPKHTKMITGTRMVDTATIQGARVLYCGSELIPTLKGMKDLHGNPAFISIEKYAAGGQTLTGEIGTIDQFRIVIVPEMLKWAGAGADIAVGDASHYETGGKYDVFPMLVIGSESFTTIGFQTDGKSVKFKIYHKKPGEQTADRNDPYGETGFMSIKWYYGFMVLRPERIGLIKTAAKI
ncbi:N4-gp56 family major capsid protein [Stutzerimonas stutzeri]|uniref:N4-gp56 family major capsid protein n=1 Tax=Stutzerimonas stutzeri TaxID=316 RepID=A0AA42PCE7_STUST|nr:N4-gp56 family major capsid protein [Stutzerimonas stutzeri]MDH1236539.1 N4-gp56 family major capsid protein [Stutzerimonas stutzeri]